MNKQEDIAKALKARLSELKRRVAEIDRELHTQLSADSEEQAIDLENQEALEAIENFGVQEIHRVEQLRRYLRNLRSVRCRHRP